MLDNSNINKIGARQMVWVKGLQYLAAYIGNGRLILSTGKTVPAKACTKRVHMNDEPYFFPTFYITLDKITPAYKDVDGALEYVHDVRDCKLFIMQLRVCRFGHNNVVAAVFQRGGRLYCLDLTTTALPNEFADMPTPYLHAVPLN